MYHKLLVKSDNSWKFIIVDLTKLHFLDNMIKSTPLYTTEVIYGKKTLIIPYCNLKAVENIRDNKPIYKEYYLYLYE